MTDDLAAQSVLLHLRRGRDGARSLSAIADEMGWSRRAVEKAAQELADDGRQPLVACERGIYLAQTADEVDAYIESLTGRLRSQYRRIRALRRVRDGMRAYQQMSWLDAA